MKNKKVIKAIENIFLCVTVFVFIFTVFTINTNNDKGIFGYKFFIVLSNSMDPEFKAGDMIITKNINPSNLENEDIITFLTYEGEVVTHQIIEVKEENDFRTFKTKGINNDSIDNESVLDSNVLGIYKFAIPKLGKVINFFKSTIGYLILIFIPFILTIYIFGKRFIKEYNKYKLFKKQELIDKLRLKIINEYRESN